MYDFKNLNDFENYNYFQPSIEKVLDKVYNYYLITVNEPIQLTQIHSIDDKITVINSTLFGYEFNRYKLKASVPMDAFLTVTFTASVTSDVEGSDSKLNESIIIDDRYIYQCYKVGE